MNDASGVQANKFNHRHITGPHYFNAVNEHQNLHSSSSGVQRLDLGLVQKWTEVFKKADSEALHMYGDT